MPDRPCQKGAHRHRRAELGKAQRPGVAGEVPDSQRFWNPTLTPRTTRPGGRYTCRVRALRGGVKGYWFNLEPILKTKFRLD